MQFASSDGRITQQSFDSAQDIAYMRQYELALILKGDLNESARKKALDSIKTLVKSLKITEEKEFGKKPLSYAIKKQNDGLYFRMKMEGETIPLDLEKRLLNQEEVLRHLLIRIK